MGSKVLVSLVGAILGFGVGWSLAARRPVPSSPPPAQRNPDLEVNRLREELDHARRELELARATAAAAPIAEATPTAKPGPEGDRLSSQLGERVRELKGILRVKDALGVKVPPGDPQMQQYRTHAVFARARELLKDEAGQLAFLSDLPTMNERELVALWDVLWLNDREKAGGLRTYGMGFARQISQSLYQQITTLTEGNQKMMMVNLLLPDTGSLSDFELAQLRTILASSTDPGIRQKAESLPNRGTR